MANTIHSKTMGTFNISRMLSNGHPHTSTIMSQEGIRTIIICKDERPAVIMELLEYLQESTLHELMQFHGTSSNLELAEALSLSK